MACYYNIKLPNGGEVKILATVSTITKDGKNKEDYQKIIEEAKKYYADTTEEVTAETPIVQVLKDLNTGLNTATLKKIVKESTAVSLIDNLNNTLSNNSGISNLNYSLKRLIWKNDGKVDYISPKGKTSKISLAEFLTKLQSPIGKKYFNSIAVSNLLNVKTLNDVKQDIDVSLDDLSQVGFTQSATSGLKNILNKAFYSDNRESKIFFDISFKSEINDAMVVQPTDSETPLIFYNGLNDLSLFIGTFKYLGSKLSKEELIPILQKYNVSVDEKKQVNLETLSVSEFFTGRFEQNKDDNVTFIDPEFNKLVKNQSVINDIIDLLVSKLSDNAKAQNDLRNNFKLLFKHLDIKNFIEGLNAKEISNISEYSTQLKRDKEIATQLTGETMLPLISSDKRDFYYSRPIVKENFTSVEDLYHYLNSNVAKGQDLLNVTILYKDKNISQSYDRLIVPTEFKLLTNGVKVSGFYEKDGKLVLENRGFIFIKKSDEITKEDNSIISHRKLISESVSIYTQDTEPLVSSESIVIVAPKNEFLPSELVYSAAVRGSTLFVPKGDKPGNNSRVVKGIYPGVIKGNSFINKQTKEKIEPNLTSHNVREMITHKSLFVDEFTESDMDKKKELLSSLDPVITSDFVPVEPNDYIASKGKNKAGEDTIVYNKVIATTDTSVYILIKTKDGKYSSKSIPKSKITTVYKKPVSYDFKDAQIIADFHKKIINNFSITESSFSLVENYEAAKNGDYLVLDNKNDTYTIYKITNKENREGIQLTINSNKIITQQYSKIPSEGVFSVITNRKIDSNNALHTAELNSKYILTEEESTEGNIRYEEIRYFIPAQFKAKELTLLDSGNLISGLFRQSIDFNPKSIPDNYVDATEDMIKLINEKRGKKGSKLLIKIKGEGAGYFIRYNMSLHQVDFKKNIYDKYLDENSYIELVSPYDSSKSGGKIYKVIGVSNNIVSLEYATFNRVGKIVTIQRQLDLNTDKDKIKWLYVMKGSASHREMEGIDKEKELSSKSINNKDEKALIRERKENLIKIADQFKKIFNIPVSIESHDEAQYKNKKAWIETSVDGRPKIILNLNNSNASSQDLVHEYLHLFLMALKYNESEGTINNIYEQLLKLYKQSFEGKTSDKEDELKKINIITKTNNWSLMEEYFVNDISSAMSLGNLDEIVDYNTFKTSFELALSKLQLPYVKLSDLSVFSILNSKMSTLFPRVNTDLSKSGLILFESNFRNWLSDQINNDKIIIEC